MAYLGIDPKVAYSSYRNIDDISASFDGFVTNFPLRVGGVAPTILPINEQQVLINVGGVPQQPDPSGANGFRLVAGNIVFSSAPSIGETFWGVILATANYISANTRFTDGSASLPSVTFASDPTTGIYYLGAGQLALSTGGTERAVVNSSGVTIHGQGDLRLADSDNSNWVALQAPATVASNLTLTAPAADGTADQSLVTDGAGALSFASRSRLVRETAKTWNWNGLTTNTSIDFTSIPSWVRKITVIFSGVSTNGTSVLLVRVGDSGGISATGYQGGVAGIVSTTASVTDSTIGFYLGGVSSSNTFIGHCTITNISGNTWISSGVAYVNATQINYFASAKTLSGILDRLSLTTANGTDTFDAGSVNIIYEG
jgi:hypothetical protein